jgi:predicted nucleic acid-binding protein
MIRAVVDTNILIRALINPNGTVDGRTITTVRAKPGSFLYYPDTWQEMGIIRTERKPTRQETLAASLLSKDIKQRFVSYYGAVSHDDALNAAPWQSEEAHIKFPYVLR